MVSGNKGLGYSIPLILSVRLSMMGYYQVRLIIRTSVTGLRVPRHLGSEGLDALM